MKIRDLVICGFSGALMYLGKFALSYLPNIEIVSILVIIFTIWYGKKALFSIYTFVFLEGLTYGFGVWFLTYLYIWLVLFIVAMIFRKQRNPLFWAIVNGIFGLLFGFLCSIIWGILYGVNAGIASFISGIPYDMLHCVGNFATALVLFLPLNKIMKRVYA